MALMALGVIFADTVNLRAKDRVTPWDVRAVEYLEEKLGGTGYDREKYCDEIHRVRRDLDGLSLRDIFRKDYKEWVEGGMKLGTSAVVQNFDYLLGRAGGSADVLMGELGKWAEEKGLDLVSVMTLATHDGRYEREVLLWGRNEKAVEASRDFEKAEQAELDLHSFRDGLLDLDAQGQWGKAWKQGNVKHSRKQVAPMIRDAMRRA
jgi:exopolyphosphatase